MVEYREDVLNYHVQDYEVRVRERLPGNPVNSGPKFNYYNWQ